MRKRYETLSKRISLFEKLAKHSEQSSFLKSIAQSAAGLAPKVKELLDSVLKNVGAVGNQVPGVERFVAPLMDALNAENPDLSSLHSAVSQVASQFSRAFGPADPRAAQAHQLLSLLSNEAAAPASNAKTLPETVITGPNAGLASIPTKIQDMLSQLLSGRGQYIPLTIDGRLGPQTQKALSIFKANYNAQNLSGQDLFNAVEQAFNTWQMNEKYAPKNQKMSDNELDSELDKFTNN